MDLAREVRRAVELRLALATPGYDLEVIARDFCDTRVVIPIRELEVVSRRLAGDGRLIGEHRQGCRAMAATARDILGWHDRLRSFDCGPLNAELIKLHRHDGVLRALQSVFLGDAACVVNGQRAR
jgi:hypothetical protein